MKIKTAHEFLKDSDMMGGSNDFLDRMIDIMDRYADQFKPKWLEVNEIHAVNCVVKPGWYFLGMNDGRIEAKYIKKSIPAKWDYFMKVEVTAIP